MTTQEYKDYVKTVEAFFKHEGINNLSGLNDQSYFFSKYPCDCCRRPLGGNRYRANGFNPKTNEVLDYIVCEDCLYYAEYGQLDDTTMMDMDEIGDLNK